MNIFYGLDSVLLNQSVKEFINVNTENSNYVLSNIYYLDQETIADQIINILNDVSTLNVFNQKKIIVINDYYSVLKNNSNLANSFIQELKKFNSNLVIFKLISSEINFLVIEKNVQCTLIKSYNKQELKKWIIRKVKAYEITLNEIAIELLISSYPNDLNIIDNELKKIKTLDQEITLEIIKNNSYKYFYPNIYRLIDFILNKKYIDFWLEYRNYWQKIKYDSYNIFSLLIMRLELIRNVKLFHLLDCNKKEVTKKFDISFLQYENLLKYNLTVEEINKLLVFAYNVDFKIKNGKTSKNIAIDLFFLKI